MSETSRVDTWAAITALAARQYGLIERSQALARGASIRGLNQRAAREGWERPHPGVLALPGSPDTPHRRVLAAVLAVRQEAWATRWTSAFLWGLTDRLRVPITLLVPHHHRAARLHAVKTVRTRSLCPEDITVRDGIPVVTPARLIADLVPVTSTPVVRALAIDARQKSLLDAGQLWSLWERFAASPRHVRLQGIAREMLGEGERPDSEFERRTRQLFSRGGLPAPYPEPFPVVVDGRVLARIDIAWPQWRVGVECDGYRYHSERRHLDRDSDRQNRLVACGWTIVRVTWRQVMNEPEQTLALVHRILMAAGADRAR